MNSIIGPHHQEMAPRTSQAAAEKKPRPQPDESLKCPRCDSTNTKFCYYNNYSLSQPRYFCKSCRRYWTKGGTLRNVPVGGGCWRSSQRSMTSSSSRITTNDHDPISPFAPGFTPFMHKLICHDIPCQIASREPMQGGFGFLENNQCDALGSYQGLGVRTTSAAEDGWCGVGFVGEGENNNRVFVGFPWQVNVGDGNYGNGISNSSSCLYNGLVSSPLM